MPKNIYIEYDEFLVDHAYLNSKERTIQFAKWYSNIRINEAIECYRKLKRQGIERQLQFDEADIRGASS